VYAVEALNRQLNVLNLEGKQRAISLADLKLPAGVNDALPAIIGHQEQWQEVGVNLKLNYYINSLVHKVVH
jgi:hypothetical protein